jgi:hypothetical protein
VYEKSQLVVFWNFPLYTISLPIVLAARPRVGVRFETHFQAQSIAVQFNDISGCRTVIRHSSSIREAFCGGFAMNFGMGLMVLALAALVFHRTALQFLLHLISFSSGTLLYALVLRLMTAVNGGTSDLQLAFLFAGAVVSGLLTFGLSFPMSDGTRSSIEGVLGIEFFPQWAYLSAWLVGGILYHVFAALTLKTFLHQGLSLTDWPLLVYAAAMVLGIAMHITPFMSRREDETWAPQKIKAGSLFDRPAEPEPNPAGTPNVAISIPGGNLFEYPEENPSLEYLSHGIVEERRNLREADWSAGQPEIDMSVDDAYHVLRISSGASVQAAQESFQSLLLRLHTGHNGSEPSTGPGRLDRDARRLEAAYRIIKEHEEKKTHSAYW